MVRTRSSKASASPHWQRSASHSSSVRPAVSIHIYCRGKRAGGSNENRGSTGEPGPGELLHVHPLHPGADAAQDVVGDGAGHTGDLLSVQGALAFGPEERNRVAGGERRGVAEVDGGQVHRDGAENGGELAAGDDLAAVGEAVEHAVRVTRAHHPDAHGTGSAKGAAIAHQGAFGKV